MKGEVGGRRSEDEDKDRGRRTEDRGNSRMATLNIETFFPGRLHKVESIDREYGVVHRDNKEDCLKRVGARGCRI